MWIFDSFSLQNISKVLYPWETQRQSIEYQKGNSEVFQKTNLHLKKIKESVKTKQITNLQNTVRCHLITLNNYDHEKEKLLVEWVSKYVIWILPGSEALE